MRKLVLITISCLFGFVGVTNAQQSLNEYQIQQLLLEDGAYEEALERLKNERSAAANLFRAKIYFRLNQLDKADQELRNIRQGELRGKALESFLSLQILNSLKKKQFSSALEAFASLSDYNLPNDFMSAMAQRYKQLLEYLSYQERKQIITKVQNGSILADILKYSIYRLNATELEDLVSFARKRNSLAIPSSLQNQITLALSDSIAYSQKLQNQQWSAIPSLGLQLGLIMPFFEQNTPEFEIVKGLYNGLLLAVEDHNQVNSDQTIYLHAINSLERDELSSHWQHLTQEIRVDWVFGPLFSEVLAQISQLDNPSSIPVFAPLANTSDFTQFQPWIFQFNPNFETRGRQSARFLIDNLDVDSVLIIAETGSLGEKSAEAFRAQMQRDSVFISEYLVEDFSRNGYDLRPYSNLFSTDTTIIDSLGIKTFEAVYAPLSGATATTMINFLMTGLESNNNYPVIIGSGEWDDYELSGLQRSRFDIYYESYQKRGDQSQDFIRFLERFQDEFGEAPNQQAILGYDMAQYLLELLAKYKNPSRVAEIISQQNNLFTGFSINIFFDQSRSNSAIHILKKE